MNKELYLNETTKVGVVVQNENELKVVKSNENEDTFRILSLQNEIERENEHVKMLKNKLSNSNNNIFVKRVCLMVDVALLLGPIIYFYDLNGNILVNALLISGSLIALHQIISKKMHGTFKENRLNIKELLKEIEKSNDKIKALEEELENLKDKCNYHENKISNEAMKKLAVVNYPDRTNEDTISNDIQSSAKINKIIFNHNGTTK